MKATKSKAPDHTVRLSTKGRLVVPKAIRERHGWSAGTELIFEDQVDRVILRQVEDRPPTRIEDLIGCTGFPPVETESAFHAATERRRFITRQKVATASGWPSK